MSPETTDYQQRMTKVLAYSGTWVEAMDLGPVLHWCYVSNGEWFVRKPDGDVRCKDFRKASELLHKLRAPESLPSEI